MTRQAQMRCPDLWLRPLERAQRRQSSRHFSSPWGAGNYPWKSWAGGALMWICTCWLPTKRPWSLSAGNWGTTCARSRRDAAARPRAGIRATTAQAAAGRTRPGRMKLVGKTEERLSGPSAHRPAAPASPGVATTALAGHPHSGRLRRPAGNCRLAAPGCGGQAGLALGPGQGRPPGLCRGCPTCPTGDHHLRPAAGEIAAGIRGFPADGSPCG